MDAYRRHSGETLATISDGMVQLHTRFYGKGPSRAKTHLIDDTIVCILWNGFTTVEQTLIAEDEAETVASFRHTFQKTMQDQFTSVIEAATGRTVIAYMSQVHVEPNVAVELFLLESGTGEAGTAEEEREDADEQAAGLTQPA